MARIPEIKRGKTVIDATGKAVGRLATEVVGLLQGKHRADYQQQHDMGDFVEVRNAAKVKITGTKLTTKVYHRHSQYPGGMTSTPLNVMFAKDPSKVVLLAVKKMLPKNKLQNGRLKRLKVHND